MIVVTGAAGFIGQHLVRHLLQRGGSPLLGLDNLYRGKWGGLAHEGRLSAVTGDVRDPAVLDRIFAGAETVFHLAAQSNVMGAVSDIDNSFSSNVVGTFNVLRAARRAGVRHVIFTSSREVYGEPAKLPVHERFPLVAKNAYGASKIACEAYCRALDGAEMRVSIVRLANVYGPGDRGRVIPIFIERALNGEPLVLHGGKQVIDFVPVGLVVEALWRVVLRAPEEPVNVGSGRATSLIGLAERVLRETGSRSPIRVTPARPMEVVRFVADVRRMREALGIEPPDDPLAALPGLIVRPTDSPSPEVREEISVA